MAYIDLLKGMTGLPKILNEKYCDCDGTFGLHDYNVQISVRNQKESFFTEVFRKVFTKEESLEKNFKSSPYKYGSNKLSKAGQGYASFPLFEPKPNDRHFVAQHRFKGRPFYEFSNLIAQN